MFSCMDNCLLVCLLASLHFPWVTCLLLTLLAYLPTYLLASLHPSFFLLSCLSSCFLLLATCFLLLTTCNLLFASIFLELLYLPGVGGCVGCVIEHYSPAKLELGMSLAIRKIINMGEK